MRESMLYVLDPAVIGLVEHAEQLDFLLLSNCGPPSIRFWGCRECYSIYPPPQRLTYNEDTDGGLQNPSSVEIEAIWLGR